jgi:hypothetical protein
MVFVLIGTIAVMVRADEKTETGKSRNDRLATRRFELMKKRVTDGNVRSAEPGFPTQFTITPIFKYSDPARGYVAAAVWKLGDRGRPRALLATELDRSTHGRPCISYEYSSLTTAPFSLSSDDMHWSPSGTLYQFKPVPNTPAPEDTSQRRLIQIREIAKRFASHEVVKDEKCELRLLPSPVDRYVPSNVDRADGAIFFFTFGTNPEVVLIIESDGRKWTYAAGRMTGAETVVLTIDDLVAWEGPPLQNGMDSPFTGSIAPIDIPGIAADGSEIAE